ncbi:hypothetical protein ACJZ2D_003583 [Fusarium nematophilum]
MIAYNPKSGPTGCHYFTRYAQAKPQKIGRSHASWRGSVIKVLTVNGQKSLPNPACRHAPGVLGAGDQGEAMVVRQVGAVGLEGGGDMEPNETLAKARDDGSPMTLLQTQQGTAIQLGSTGVSISSTLEVTMTYRDDMP